MIWYFQVWHKNWQVLWGGYRKKKTASVPAKPWIRTRWWAEPSQLTANSHNLSPSFSVVMVGSICIFSTAFDMF